jgi:hypothetical protein
LKHTLEFFDCLPQLRANQQPTVGIVVSASETWHVAAAPISLVDSDAPTQWVYTKGGLVRIPLFTYRVTLVDPHQAWAAALSLATHAVAGRAEPGDRVHWVLGTPFETKEAGEAMLCWMGIAIVKTR